MRTYAKMILDELEEVSLKDPNNDDGLFYLRPAMALVLLNYIKELEKENEQLKKFVKMTGLLEE